MLRQGFVSYLSEQIKNKRCTNEVVFQWGNLPTAGRCDERRWRP